MPARRHPPLLPLLVAALALAEAPRAPAQAGISGNALGGQAEELRGANSNWDRGLKSQSALGQLEELAGAKVDRSSTPQPYRTTKKPTQHQLNTRAFNQALASALVDELFTALMNDNAAARAKAEAEAQAAAAAAAAEAARVAEEARQARIKLAGKIRQGWDAQDQAISSSLSGAFDTPGGTNFFSQPVNRDDQEAAARLLSDLGAPTETDEPAVVRLPDNPHLGVDPARLGTPVGAGPAPGAPGGPALLRSEAEDPDTALPELKPRTALEEAALHAAGWYGDTMQEAVKDGLWNLAFGRWLEKLDRLPGAETVKALLEFKDKYEELSDPLRAKTREIQELYGRGALDAARILGSRRLSDGGYADSYLARVEDLGGETAREARGLAFGEVAGQTIDGPEFGPGDGDDEPEFSLVRPLNGLTRGRYGHIRVGDP